MLFTFAFLNENRYSHCEFIIFSLCVCVSYSKHHHKTIRLRKTKDFSTLYLDLCMVYVGARNKHVQTDVLVKSASQSSSCLGRFCTTGRCSNILPSLPSRSLCIPVSYIGDQSLAFSLTCGLKHNNRSSPLLIFSCHFFSLIDRFK